MALVLTHRRSEGARIITPSDSIEVIVKNIELIRNKGGRKVKQACIEINDFESIRYVNLNFNDPPYQVREDLCIFIGKSPSSNSIQVCYQGSIDKYYICRIYPKSL